MGAEYATRDVGWLITQAATKHPSMRHVEDPRAGGLAWLLTDAGFSAPRITAMERAAYICLMTDVVTPRFVYAMGHTHRPCVKRIRVRVGDPDGVS